MNAVRKPRVARTTAEVGATKVIGFTNRRFAIFVIGILFIVLGILMLAFPFLEILVCFLTSGYVLIGFGFLLISVGFLFIQLPFPPTPLGRLIVAGISGLIAFIFFIISWLVI